MERSVGFSDILATLYQKSCVIPFFCETKQLTVNKKVYMASVINGAGVIREHIKEPVVTPNTFDNTARYTDNGLEPRPLDGFKVQLMMIAKHILECVAYVFNSSPFNISLDFGILEDSRQIWLLDTSSCSVLVDIAEFEFQEFYLKEISKPRSKAVCQCRRRDCGKPSFVVSQTAVLLYRTSRRFKEFDKTRLRRIIKARRLDPEPKCFVCVRCISLLQADVACAKRGKTRVLAPEDLHPLFPSETGIRKGVLVRPIGGPPSMQKNCSFALNLEESPYKERLKMPKRPEQLFYEKTKPLTPPRREDVARLAVAGFRPRTPGSSALRKSTALNLTAYKRKHKMYAEQLEEAVCSPKG